jgi:hypothetical protein
VTAESFMPRILPWNDPAPMRGGYYIDERAAKFHRFRAGGRRGRVA